MCVCWIKLCKHGLKRNKLIKIVPEAMIKDDDDVVGEIGNVSSTSLGM